MGHRRGGGEEGREGERHHRVRGDVHEGEDEVEEQPAAPPPLPRG